MKYLKKFEQYNPAEIGEDDYIDDWDQAYDHDDADLQYPNMEPKPVDPIDDEDDLPDEDLPF